MVARVLDCEAVVLTLWRQTAPSIGVSGIAVEAARRLAAMLEPVGDHPSGSVPDAGTLADTRTLSFRTELGQLGLRSAIRAPLTLGGDVAGLLLALGAEERRPDPALLNALARMCEFAIEYGLSAETNETSSDLDALVLSTDSFESLMTAMTRLLSERLGRVSVGVSLLDHDSGLLITADGSFGLPRSVTKNYSIDPNDLHSNAARVFELRRPFASNRVIGDPAILQSYPIAFGIESMLALPLVVSGRSTGVLLIANKAGGFTAGDMEVATTTTPQIALAVELTRLAEARRFEHRAESLVADLRVVSADAHTDAERLRSVLRRTLELLAADELRLDGGPDIVVRTESSAVGPAPYSIDVECGGADPAALVLRATRTFGDFTPSERRLLGDLARVISEAMIVHQTKRQEAELAQHRERQRIADDLHDDVSQLLFVAQLALDARPEPEIRRASELIRRAENALRDAIFVLQSPPDAPTAELGALVTAFREEWGIRVRVSIDPRIDELLPSALARELVRAARECLTNAAKHAQPRNVSLTARVADDASEVELCVSDDGVGFEHDRDQPSAASPRGYGLRALRRRISGHRGSVSVRANPATGTTVTVRMVISGAPDAD